MGARRMVNLEIRSGSRQGERFSFPGNQTIRIGQSEQAEICVSDDPLIADVHVQIDVSREGCQLRNLAPKQIVLVNGKAVRAATLSPGDVLHVGKTEFQYLIGDLGDSRGVRDSIAATVMMPAGTNAESKADGMAIKRPAKVEPAVFPIRIPGYSPSRMIGRGGMGTVFEAVRDGDGEKVAIKILNAPQAAGRDMQLFLREASVLSGLNHPRIVRFREVGWAEGQIFIVMEYVESVDLPKMFKAMSSASRIRLGTGIIIQVLQALEYAHRRRIVHRDVKPSNILVTRTDGKLQCKLSDFGLAKNFESAGFSAMTADGEARGTLAYMAPEQLQNSRYAKPAADIFSVGVTLFNFLSGQLPFVFPCTPEQRTSALKAVHKTMERHLPELPVELSQQLMRAMATEPGDRFATAEEMRMALVPFAKSAKS